MTEDMGRYLGKNRALYLPALQVPFVTQSASVPELDYLDPNNPIFHYPKSLYSIGHVTMSNTNGSDMVYGRDRNKTMIFGDSGGFQIATGKGQLSKINWSDAKSRRNCQKKVLTWLEDTADWSMTLDHPLAGVGKNDHLKTSKDCLDYTVDGLKYFAANRSKKTQFCNVLQGNDTATCDAWYDAVKGFEFEGWAFADKQAKNLYEFLRRIFILRRDGMLEGRKWIHILGVSAETSAVIFSIVKSHLEDIEISFDSSTPFKGAGKGFAYASHDPLGEKKLRMTAALPKEKKYIGHKKFIELDPDEYLDEWEGYSDMGEQKRAFWEWVANVESPVFDRLEVQDLCNKAANKYAWSQLSYNLVALHNVHAKVKAIAGANAQYQKLKKFKRLYDHKTYKVVCRIHEIIDQAFAAPDPLSVINKNIQRLSQYKLGR